MNESQRLSPDELVARLAQRARLSQEQVRALLQAQAELASEQAQAEQAPGAQVVYPVPGIGILQLTNRRAGTFVMQFGPKKGQTIAFPAKKVLKFFVCRMMKEVVNLKGMPAKAMPDLFDPKVFEDAWYPPDIEPED